MKTAKNWLGAATIGLLITNGALAQATDTEPVAKPLLATTLSRELPSSRTAVALSAMFAGLAALMLLRRNAGAR